MLFSVGCLQGKTGDASEADSLSASYSTQLWKTLGPKGYLKTLLRTRAASLRLIVMLEEQVEDAFNIDGVFNLDDAIADHQQECEADQEIDSASADGFEDAVPSDMLDDDLVLLDWAVSRLEDLITLASKRWSDRHVFDNATPSLSLEEGRTMDPGADTLYAITNEADSRSTHCSRDAMINDLNIWSDSHQNKCHQTPTLVVPLLEYSWGNVNLQHMQQQTGAADNLQHMSDNISPQDWPLFTAGLAEMWTWTSKTYTPSGLLELLRRDPIPVWAMAPEMKVCLSDLRQAY